MPKKSKRIELIKSLNAFQEYMKLANNFAK